jgi:hypothetical protein
MDDALIHRDPSSETEPSGTVPGLAPSREVGPEDRTEWTFRPRRA